MLSLPVVVLMFLSIGDALCGLIVPKCCFCSLWPRVLSVICSLICRIRGQVSVNCFHLTLPTVTLPSFVAQCCCFLLFTSVKCDA